MTSLPSGETRNAWPGVVVAVLILAGAALLAYFKPQGKLGGTSLFTDRATNQLYVLLAKSDRAAVELQRVVKHPGVPAHDGVFEPAQQKTPAANLNLGGEAKPHSSFSHVEVCVHRGDSLRHI